MSILEKANARKISDILHFSTSNGLLGILATGKLLAYSALPAEKRLSHILQFNCKDRRRDKEWHDYINLSISRINGSFFTISQGWHATEDIFWCILGFPAEILDHTGVIFATTNNAYPMTQRAPDESGFEALFARSIRQYPTKWVTRSGSLDDSYTTCHQAEVLYPKELSLQYLKNIYVKSHEHADEVMAQIGVLNTSLPGNFRLIVAPDLF
jgi:hypothetical protein